MLTRRQCLGWLASVPLLADAASSAAKGRPSVADDIGVLREALAIHPGLRRYLTASEVARRLAVFEQEYGSALLEGRLDQAYLALSLFLAAIRCGHSYANFFNQTRPDVKALFDRATRLPFAFEWIDRSMVVTADHSGTDLVPRGTRVLACNGLDTASIAARLLPYVRADGHNDAKRYSLLGVRGADDIETFDVFQGLLLPPAGNVHRLSILRPDGWQGNIELAAIDLAARRHGLFHAPPDPLAPRWNYERRPDGIATLDMPDWETWTSKWDWQEWLADRLDDAQSAQGLIIDLRRNEGGNNCGDPILSRLTDRELPGWSVDPRVRFREVSQNLSQHAETWDDSFRRLGADAPSIGEGWYRLTDQIKETRIAPAPQQLRNRVAVLIGPANSSATFAFANAARATGRVRLFGEPTGGNRRGINGGAFLFVTLPYSGIEFDLPLIGYFPLEQQPDEGILPDVTVTATAHSIAEGRDPVLETAAAWIQSGKR